MRKNLIIPIVILGVTIAACGGKSDSPTSVAQKWCDMNAKVYKAAEGSSEYTNAKAAREKYEKDIESKYKDDKAFMDELEKEVEKCEDASEGR